MSNLIDRQAAIDMINVRLSQPCKNHTSEFVQGMEDGYCRIRSDIKCLPSAQPEIIRCKDCKHRPIAHRAAEGVFWGFSLEFPDDMCPFECDDGWYNSYPKDDFYCAYAERKEK